MKTRIQDVREFENEIASRVDEYLQEKECYAAPVMTIGHESGELVIDIDEINKVRRTADCEEYAINDLFCINEEGVEEPNYDRINVIANEWVFIEH